MGEQLGSGQRVPSRSGSVLAAFLRGLEPHADVEELFRRHSEQLGALVMSGGVAKGEREVLGFIFGF
jgi:hypothetical protein